LYTWADIMPPWVQEGQKQALPWLMNRAQTGMTPQEEKQMWGQAQGTLEDASQAAGLNFSRQIAGSGISPSSGAVAGGYADLASDRVANTSKAALDFAKMKMGARDTAIGQMLSALYAASPAAVGQKTEQRQDSIGTTKSGGGK
jgi:hypothetical protein